MCVVGWCGWAVYKGSHSVPKLWGPFKTFQIKSIIETFLPHSGCAWQNEKWFAGKYVSLLCATEALNILQLSLHCSIRAPRPRHTRVWACHADTGTHTHTPHKDSNKTQRLCHNVQRCECVALRPNSK